MKNHHVIFAKQVNKNREVRKDEKPLILILIKKKNKKIATINLISTFLSNITLILHGLNCKFVSMNF